MNSLYAIWVGLHFTVPILIARRDAGDYVAVYSCCLEYQSCQKVLTVDWLLRWDYIVGYLPLIWKSGLFPTFNAANIVLIPYLDNMFGLQSHTKSLESNRTLFTLMGSHIHNSKYSLIMSFNDIKIICETFWMLKTLYLMVPWSFATLEPEKIDQILIFQFVQWLCLCDVKYLPLKVFGQRGCLIF